MHNTRSCLIVGAGMAGLTAARELTLHGWRVQIIDKGRNPGGRMATRRKGPAVFDHGAQFFTARSAEFRGDVNRWLALGWVRTWFGDAGHERYCSVDGMNGLAAKLAEGLDVQFGVAVQGIARHDVAWIVTDAEGQSTQADALLLTAPVPQSIALAGSFLSTEELAGLAQISYDPCIALMVRLADAAGSIPEPGYLSTNGDVLAVISDNTQKGLASAPAHLTLHSSGDFAREYWDRPQEVAAAKMLEAARGYLPAAASVESWQYHRWRYSQVVSQYPESCFASGTLVLAGDGFGGGRLEGAYLSGLAAANFLKSL